MDKACMKKNLFFKTLNFRRPEVLPVEVKQRHADKVCVRIDISLETVESLFINMNVAKTDISVDLWKRI